MADLYLDEGFIKVTGKGNKERLVPISGRAIHEINLYLQERCHINIRPEYDRFLFLSTRRGTSMSRITVFDIIKKLCKKAGIKKSVSPHTFRHSSHTLWKECNLRPFSAAGNEKNSTTEIYNILTEPLREYLTSPEIIYHTIK